MAQRQHSRVRVRRIYDEPDSADGTRILVDRVWPRGMRKDAAELDEWCKQVAPSTELRKWYQHDEQLFDQFTQRYRGELTDEERAEAFEHLRSLALSGPVTLLTASKQVDISHAEVLRELLSG